uniref:Putative transcription factor adf-1-like papilio machaon n=1 Tax=Lutzomyia longipalpis TaxID=7200 RepID=A0A1B0CXD3_LUTLO
MDKNKLIELVQQHPALYDTTHQSYHDMSVKKQAWKSIARELDLPMEKIRRRWTSLRDSYRRTYAKHKGPKPENASDHIPLKCWVFGMKMSYLYPFLRMRRYQQDLDEETVDPLSDNEEATMECIPVLSPSAFKEDSHTFPSTGIQHDFMESKNNEGVDDTGSVSSAEFPTLPESQETVVVSLLKHILKERQEIDDIGQFFECMATTVRTFPPQYRAQVKTKVFEIVNKTELEILSKPSSSRSFNS